MASCLVLDPETMDREWLKGQIAEQISLRGLYHDTILLHGKNENDSPLRVLTDEAEISWKPPHVSRTFDKLSDHGVFPENSPDLFFIEGIESLSNTAYRAWVDALDSWSVVTKKMKDKGVSIPCICMVAKTASQIDPPEDSLFFKVFHW